MTKVKFCGLARREDIEAANRLAPDYVGFVFAHGSRRRVDEAAARELKALLAPGIRAVGVFVDEPPRRIADLANAGTINVIQLHGEEDAAYLEELRRLTAKPVIQAFCVSAGKDLARAEASRADFLLLDSGRGEGRRLDWEILAGFRRPYFLAGGLDARNVAEAMARLHPFGLDVSSGIETGGRKDERKMAAFLAAVRKKEKEGAGTP